MKPSVEKAIAARRQQLRGGRSVRQVSRDKHDIDSRNGEWRKIRNRTTWAQPRRQPAVPRRATDGTGGMTDSHDIRDAYALVRDNVNDPTLRMLLMQLEVRHLIADQQASLADTLIGRAREAISKEPSHDH